MPRKPTGRPTGRPPGSGTLGEVTRFTVRLPTPLYQKLQTFADGRAYTRGDPELSGCVRALLEHALTCPYKRQTASDTFRQTAQSTDTAAYTSWQIESGIQPPGDVSHVTEDITRQTENVLDPLPQAEETINSQTENIPEASLQPTESITCQTENIPPFDPARFFLGTLCTHGHAYPGTTQQSLRKLAGKLECQQCCIARDTRYRERKRQAAPVA